MICGAGWIILRDELHRKVRPVGQTDPDQPRSEEITKIGDLWHGIVFKKATTL